MASSAHYIIFDDEHTIVDCKSNYPFNVNDLHRKQRGREYSIVVHSNERGFNFNLSSYVARHELVLHIDCIDDGTDLETFIMEFATMVAELNNWQ